MFQKLKSDHLSWLLLFGAFFLLLDAFFFNRGLIFSLIIATGMVYIGWKRMPKKTGKILFWVGIFLVAVNLFNTLAIRFLLLAFLLFLIIQYANSKKEAKTIAPTIMEPEETKKREGTFIKGDALVQNKLFGHQRTENHVYEWDDVNIQAGIGNTEIDLSNTVLPQGESTIFIRNIIGKVTILIPYDIEISVQHSVLFGSATILDYYEETLINRSIKIKTTDYEQTTQKVKIFTSMIVGDLEVKRV